MSFADPPRRRAPRSALARIGWRRLALYGVLGNLVGSVAAFAAAWAWLTQRTTAVHAAPSQALVDAAFFAGLTAAFGLAYLLVAVPLFALALRHGRRAVVAAGVLLALVPAAIVLGERFTSVVALIHGLAAAGVATVLVLRSGRRLRIWAPTTR